MIEMHMFEYYNSLESKTNMDADSAELAKEKQQPSGRPFQCSCGRTYKSSPALYTHVRNKHNGTPPGQLGKSSHPKPKRSRHPLQKPSSPQKLQQTAVLSVSPLKEPTAQDAILKLAGLLQDLASESLNRSHLNEISSILQMNVYLVSAKGEKGLFVGNVLSEFFSQLSRHISWEKFEQVYTVVMLLVQFIMDELGSAQVIREGPVDLLCDFINDFLQVGVRGMAEYYAVGELAMLREENLLDIFEGLFQWLMLSHYTNYRICLNSPPKTLETCAEF